MLKNFVNILNTNFLPKKQMTGSLLLYISLFLAILGFQQSLISFKNVEQNITEYQTSQPSDQRSIQTISQNTMAEPLQDLLRYQQEDKVNIASKKYSAISAVLQEEPFAPFLRMIPNQNGTSMMIQTNQMESLNEDIFINTSEIGPAGHKHSWTTMSYSETTDSYVVSISGLTPLIGVDLAMNITSTSGLQTGSDQVRRHFVPTSDTPTLTSIDSLFSLSFHNPESLPSDAYIALTTHGSGALPGSLPEGYQHIGYYVYSVNASGSLLQADKILTLKIIPPSVISAAVDSKSLTIMAWNASTSEWEDRGGQSSSGSSTKDPSISTKDFTAYILAAKSTVSSSWFTDFIGFGELSDYENVTIDFDNTDDNDFVLILDNTTEGYALTKDITLPSGNYVWDQVTFNSVNSAATNVVVDVLSASNTVLIPDVTNGGSLASIDPIADPTIRLRVSLQSSVDGETPQVDFVRVSWQQQVPTATPTMTATVTATHTPPPTETPMSTETNTLIPSPTFMGTSVPSTSTPTSTGTDIPTPSPTATHTIVSATSTPTATETDIPTPSPTATHTLTTTSTSTPTVTDTLTSSPTVTDTVTSTSIPTPAVTDTIIPTSTPTPTGTDTSTPSPTVIDIATSTPTPTETDTLTPSPTATDTIALTSTPTPTGTDTLTPSPTATNTIVTSTNTSTPADTPLVVTETVVPIPVPTPEDEHKIFLPWIEN